MTAYHNTEQAAAMSAAIEITDATFEADVLRSPTLTILDLWAEWCIPCKRIAPILDEIATQYNGKIRIGKLDVDTNPVTPGNFGVSSIPTVIIVDADGNVLKRSGFMSRDATAEFLKRGP
jgi:thioredoxin 1